MKFIITGYDYVNENALEIRMKARDEHMKGIEKMFSEKKILFAAAMTNKNGDMCGSTMMVDFENRELLDLYLEKEPYVVNKVWEKVEVTPCKIPLMFLNK